MWLRSVTVEQAIAVDSWARRSRLRPLTGYPINTEITHRPRVRRHPRDVASSELTTTQTQWYVGCGHDDDQSASVAYMLLHAHAFTMRVVGENAEPREYSSSQAPFVVFPHVMKGSELFLSFRPGQSQVGYAATRVVDAIRCSD